MPSRTDSVMKARFDADCRFLLCALAALAVLLVFILGIHAAA